MTMQMHYMIVTRSFNKIMTQNTSHKTFSITWKNAFQDEFFIQPRFESHRKYMDHFKNKSGEKDQEFGGKK